MCHGGKKKRLEEVKKCEINKIDKKWSEQSWRQPTTASLKKGGFSVKNRFLADWKVFGNWQWETQERKWIARALICFSVCSSYRLTQTLPHQDSLYHEQSPTWPEHRGRSIVKNLCITWAADPKSSSISLSFHYCLLLWGRIKSRECEKYG